MRPGETIICPDDIAPGRARRDDSRFRLDVAGCPGTQILSVGKRDAHCLNELTAASFDRQHAATVCDTDPVLVLTPHAPAAGAARHRERSRTPARRARPPVGTARRPAAPRRHAAGSSSNSDRARTRPARQPRSTTATTTRPPRGDRERDAKLNTRAPRPSKALPAGRPRPSPSSHRRPGVHRERQHDSAVVRARAVRGRRDEPGRPADGALNNDPTAVRASVSSVNNPSWSRDAADAATCSTPRRRSPPAHPPSPPARRCGSGRPPAALADRPEPPKAVTRRRIDHRAQRARRQQGRALRQPRRTRPRPACGRACGLSALYNVIIAHNLAL